MAYTSRLYRADAVGTEEEGTAFIVITDDDIVIHITGALNI
jgi:hypothetical protein